MSANVDVVFAGVVERVKAAATKIVDPYFSLPTTGTEGGILRERVYAYELYHQLRCLSDSGHPILTAEPDKRGHKEIRDGSNPDFVFHAPGRMTENVAILEVKRSSSNDVGGDIEKFDRYRNQYKYHYCLWLVFGQDEDARFEQRFSRRFREGRLRGHLLWHRASGSAPVVVA